MPPAASEDFFHPINHLSLDNHTPLSQSPGSVQESTGGKKKKKGKNKHGTKGKDTLLPQTDQMAADEIQPSPPSQSDPSSYPGNVFTPPSGNAVISPASPVLGALDPINNNNPESDTVLRTDAWAKSIPFGKSPPNDILDPAFASGSPHSIPNTLERAAFGSHISSSASPPIAPTRPMNYGPVGIGSPRHPSIDRQKRHSMGAHFQSQPPLPHLPQAHFYGAPEIDIPSPHRSGAGSQYSFCGWDSIPGPFLKTSKIGGRVLLVGTDGELHVIAIESQKTRTVGTLTGLNGRVLDAKILNYASRPDPYASSRPHVAVIIHGPVAHKDEPGDTSSIGSEQNEILPGLPGKSVPSEKPQNKEDTLYQTRVEIYSVKTGDHIMSLFQSKPAPCFESYPNLSLLAPAPVGSLRLYTTTNYVIVASGVSGEVFIYGIVSSGSAAMYQCLGKTWTTIQSKEVRRYSTSSSSTDHDGSQADSQHGPGSSENPIISLSGRWLAVVPPTSSSRAPPLGSVPQQCTQRKIHGLDTHIPPSKPTINCATDVGDGESLFDKVARGVTQELFKGARWMGDQGLQAWNNYWNKDQQASQGGNRRSSPYPDTQQGTHALFPPTHGQETSGASSSEPDLVSIIDLKRLEHGQDPKGTSPVPFATFQAPNGCSYLSFAPNGHMLLTASKKGDVQYVWDLMQAKNCRTAAFLSDDLTGNNASTSHVRLIARYSRLTTSNIIDIVWAYPTGEKFAVLTRKGTVHVYDIPRVAFQWPPLRRVQAKPSRPQLEDPASSTPESEGVGSASPFVSAMKFMGGTTQPILAAVRGRAPSVGSSFSGTPSFGISSAAGIGGKAVAAGLSKSMGAATGTVSTLRHVGENRLHLTSFGRDPMASRVTWVLIHNESLLGVIDYGSFKIYKVKRSTDRNKARRHQPVIGGKVAEMKLPEYMQNPSGPLQIGLPMDDKVVGSWSSPLATSHPSSVTKLSSQPLSQAEIETNTPYQPFHTDRRVTLNVIIDPTSAAGPPLGSWVFGNDIQTQKLHVQPLPHSDDEELTGQMMGNPEMENLISLGNGGDQVEEVVITTKRKKKTSAALSPTGHRDDDDGFFEDDCDVLDFAQDRV
ncbi:hypothetical protein BGW36DRAFT_293062 [Talaromyces proteolyticus]|uniref:BCAS3 domain-containing protein n=1 Tax=Talaromyces proteolyticus TaxID=1131652 RepID=A0AAD4KWB5_9EURO|nr:uncharacterized protein BGW36DRAFT_293062 [Talaromyces proteolyticus]KAH8700668.1 hypothetical protein BGW36DRAFT_293062 [Talaromyces proteolyticus]